MNVQSRKITVQCPSCHRTYESWISPLESSTGPKLAFEDCHTECHILTCPACQHEIPCNVTVVKDAVFQVQCGNRLN